MKRVLFLSSVVLLLLSVAAKLGGQATSADAPNPRLTPGAWSESAAIDCTPGRTRAERGFSRQQAVRREIFAAYGVPYDDHSRYELDHLVPLCLNGLDTRENLWPEPRFGDWSAQKKDRLEACACRLACQGQLDTAAAQRLIAADWRMAYATIVPLCGGARMRRAGWL